MAAGFDPETDRDRRRFLRAMAAGGLAGLAGCGMGGDGDDGTSTSPPTTTEPPTSPPPTATSTTTTTPPTSTEEPTTTQPIVEGATWRLYVPPPKPDSVQYSSFPGATLGSGDARGFWFGGSEMMRLRLFQRSVVDLEFVPEAAAEWNYRNGVLDVRLREDHYWASDSQEERSPVNVTADDWVDGTWFHRGYWGTDTGDPFVKVEKRGEYAFRLFYEDSFHADWALQAERFWHFTEGYNAAFWRPYIEQLADASTRTQMEAVHDEARNLTVSSPHPTTNVPFRVSGTGDDRWHLTLRDDEERTPRWVDDLTFESAEIVVREDITRQTQAFREGRLPFAGARPGGFDHTLSADEFDPAVVDVDVPFETDTLTLPRERVPGCYALNAQRPPTDSVHFRRALAYLLDREAHCSRFMQGDRVLTGFTMASDERRYVSDALLDALREGPHDNYGYASVMSDAAIAELEAGGFEVDSEGRRLHRSGDRQGEPISLTIPTYPWMRDLADRAGGFVDALASVGIDATVEVRDSSDLWGALPDGEHAVALVYWGGRLPYPVYWRAFNDAMSSLYGMAGLPDAWEGPPVGEFSTPPGSATGNTETYDVRQMVDTLPSVGWGGGQELVDRLAWVYNQSVVKLPIGHLPFIWTVDTQHWRWPTPTEDHPTNWTGLPRSKLWVRGDIRAVRQG